MKHKYSKGDAVLIYDCIELPGGGVGVILDKDALELSYEVKDVTSIDKTLTRWVHEENLMKLQFDKPKSIFHKILRSFWA